MGRLFEEKYLLGYDKYNSNMYSNVHEAPMIGTCIMNIQEEGEPKNIQGKAATTALNALQLLFLPHFCEENL